MFFFFSHILCDFESIHSFSVWFKNKVRSGFLKKNILDLQQHLYVGNISPEIFKVIHKLVNFNLFLGISIEKFR